MIPRIRSYRTYERILQVLWNVGARYADVVERAVPEASKRTKQGQTRSVRGRRAQLIKKNWLLIGASGANVPFKGRMFQIHFPMIQIALYVESS